MGNRTPISAVRKNHQRRADRQSELDDETQQLVAQSQAALRHSYALLARTYRQSRGGWDAEEEPNRDGP